MLVSIGGDMATTWRLCGTDAKLMLGRMLVNIKCRLKLIFNFFFAMLGNLHKREAITQC